MKKIPSFTIDHLRLKRGIYLSRQDTVGNNIITTFDIRLKEPYRETPLGADVQHTIEHLAATFLRNDPQWGAKIIYWGPMGCQTGNYLIINGNPSPSDILPLIKRTFAFIASYEGPIPGATPQDCGNYLLNNLPQARQEAQKFLDLLNNITDENLNYPK